MPGCRLQHIPNCIVAIHSMGSRIVVSDSQDSFHFVRYKRTENQLIVFADDTNQRWITSACLVDYDTIAGADKFGNITMVRSLPPPRTMCNRRCLSVCLSVFLSVFLSVCLSVSSSAQKLRNGFA